MHSKPATKSNEALHESAIWCIERTNCQGLTFSEWMRRAGITHTRQPFDARAAFLAGDYPDSYRGSDVPALPECVPVNVEGR